MNLSSFISTFDPHMEHIDNDGGHSKAGLDEQVETRDLISGIVGDWKNLKEDDKSAIITRLGSILGKPKAQKLINSAFIFNQRDDVKGKNAQDRVNEFYNLGSDDKEVNEIIQRSKSLGYGINSGLRSSPDITNKEIIGEKVSGDKKDVAASDKVMKLAGKIIPQ
jgi:hypothetical protein